MRVTHTRTAADDTLKLQIEALESATVDGVFTFDRGGNVISASERAARLFSYDEAELLGKPLRLLMPSEEAIVERENLDATGETTVLRVLNRTRQLRGLRKTGEVFPFRLTVREVDVRGAGMYIGVVHDLSEYERSRGKILELHRQLQSTNEQLEASVKERTSQLEQTVNDLALANRRLAIEVKEREHIAQSLAKRELQLERLLTKERELGELKSRFVSMASHEFRTPLTTMLSSVELIEMSTPDAPELLLKHCRRIKEGVGYLRNVLEDFLQLGKLDAKGTDLQHQELDLRSFIDQLVEELNLMCKPGQDIEVEYVGEVGSTTNSANGIRIILTNLLTNAIKYSGDGTAIDVRVARSETGEELEISVFDEGIGIPENERRLLFERFYRASNAETIKGTGLGLHIVMRYLRAMNGAIDVDDRLSGGSVFTVTFPYAA